MNNFEAMLVEEINLQISEHFKRFRAEIQEDFDKKVQEAANPAPYMTRKQVCDYLGVSFPTVHGWMNAGLLPYTKVGNATRFLRSDVEKFIKSRRARRA